VNPFEGDHRERGDEDGYGNDIHDPPGICT
jgi:hypothetical protein